MKYKKGFKYQLEETEYYNTGILGYDIQTKYLSLVPSGSLKIMDGYAWDGPSGPTVDTKTFMRGSLIHDALYELIRKGLIDHKEVADQLLYNICLEDGMWSLRAKWVYVGVHDFGKSATLSKNVKKILEAP